MKFIRNISFNKNKSLAVRIDTAACELENKLISLAYRSLPISDYGKNYYAYDLRKLRYMLRSYSGMLFESVLHTGKDIETVTIIDHGGGIGIFSMLAKFSGTGTVICQDINPTISKDAEIISKTLGIRIDHFVSGEAEDLVNYSKENKLKIDILGSRNVIEHIYDINLFLKCISDLPADKLILYISTTANMKNPLVNSYTRKIHNNYEYKGKPTEWGGKEKDPETSCLNVRKKIIKEKFSSLNENELKELSIRTRGLMIDEIYSLTEKYLKTKQFPSPISDPTNTCDPYTGNWAEHLVPIKDYKKMAENNGFTFEYQCGSYNTNYPQKVLNLITPILNFLIRLLGKRGLFLAPFMTMIMIKKTETSKVLK